MLSAAKRGLPNPRESCENEFHHVPIPEHEMSLKNSLNEDDQKPPKEPGKVRLVSETDQGSLATMIEYRAGSYDGAKLVVCRKVSFAFSITLG